MFPCLKDLVESRHDFRRQEKIVNQLKFNLKNKDLVAPCGLYCGECDAFQGGRCGGCISRKGLCLKYTKICKIYSCCVGKKGLRVCGQCKEFPCRKFPAFFDTPAWRREVLGNLRRIEKIGIEKFLEEEVKRVSKLIECAEKHGLIHCSQCKEWPCKILKRPPLIPD